MTTSSRKHKRVPFRPKLEILEERTLMSVCTVDRLTDNNPAGGGEGDNGRGDLRWCVIESLFRADTINFDVTGTINLAAALPNLTRGVSIEGPGADLMTVRRETGGFYTVFTVATGINISISGITITNGNGSSGGGISNSGTLTVSNSTISGNAYPGIFNSGMLMVSNSTISGNTGGITNSGTMTVNNSTISGNTSGPGGGISNQGGTMTVNNSTISGNTAGS